MWCFFNVYHDTGAVVARNTATIVTVVVTANGTVIGNVAVDVSDVFLGSVVFIDDTVRSCFVVFVIKKLPLSFFKDNVKG